MSTTAKRVLRAVELRQPNGKPASFLVNRDLLPVPPEERLWKAINYATFWLADSFNVNTFMIASSGISLGLTWWQVWLAVWCGYAFAGVFVVLNATAGAKYHIIFPAYIRSSFGIYGGLWPTFNRALMACVWCGVQSWIAGQAVYTLILAIWPSFANLPNGIPSSGTDTAHFLSFFLFNLLLGAVVWFPIHTIRHLFTVKAVVAPAGGIVLLILCLVKANGAGDLLTAPATISGSTLGWEFIAQLMSCISNMATLATNAVDFASRASKPSDVVLPQLIALPFTFAITSLIGILIGASTETLFGEFVWSPLDVMERFLKVEGGASHGMRAGVAFISIAFIIAQLGTNVAANTISAGADLTSIFPRFLSIRRGGYIAVVVGFCMCPWHLMSSSANFATYLSAYSVLLSSIVGVMVCHYYVIGKRQVAVHDLYEKDGLYTYFHGFNLRAYAAYVAGIAPNITGMAGACGADVPLAATRIYTLSFFVGFGVAFATYWLLCLAFPLPVPTVDEVAEVPAALASGAARGELKRQSSTETGYEVEKDEKADEEGTARGAVELV
ncbi:NCS1 nucleoside transporter family [Rhodotorula diobovata]|uniref:NCS1 nucleoside transporter family n=1 Tax=Rhodotorula diobovata TaxID=5288 RepID=A0A5C5FTJ4_9BASI|nr:NCS1 nucleoside transporter family [Rhodotorula diobovata]